MSKLHWLPALLLVLSAPSCSLLFDGSGFIDDDVDGSVEDAGTPCTMGTCSSGEYCELTSRTCVPGCEGNADCTVMGETCNTHVCGRVCETDAQCMGVAAGAPGGFCESGGCVPCDADDDHWSALDAGTRCDGRAGIVGSGDCVDSDPFVHPYATPDCHLATNETCDTRGASPGSRASAFLPAFEMGFFPPVRVTDSGDGEVFVNLIAETSIAVVVTRAGPLERPVVYRVDLAASSVSAPLPLLEWPPGGDITDSFMTVIPNEGSTLLYVVTVERRLDGSVRRYVAIADHAALQSAGVAYSVEILNDSMELRGVSATRGAGGLGIHVNYKSAAGVDEQIAVSLSSDTVPFATAAAPARSTGLGGPGGWAFATSTGIDVAADLDPASFDFVSMNFGSLLGRAALATSVTTTSHQNLGVGLVDADNFRVIGNCPVGCLPIAIRAPRTASLTGLLTADSHMFGRAIAGYLGPPWSAGRGTLVLAALEPASLTGFVEVPLSLMPSEVRDLDIGVVNDSTGTTITWVAAEVGGGFQVGAVWSCR